MPHGGSVWWNSPVRMLLKILNDSPLLAAHIPVSRHFFGLIVWRIIKTQSLCNTIVRPSNLCQIDVRILTNHLT